MPEVDLVLRDTVEAALLDRLGTPACAATA
jgi:hypothetical protein